MNIVITGGSGLVGRHLVPVILRGNEITVITRNTHRASRYLPKTIRLIQWENEQYKQIIADSDVVINLAGENIGGHLWSTKQKEKIISSRVKSANRIVNACLAATGKSPRIINASAIGVYGVKSTLGEQMNTCFTEDTVLPTGNKDFLSAVGTEWENALIPAIERGVSVVKLRFAVILSPNGGMLKKILFPFKMGLGGRIGTGKQPVSWVALDDVIRVIQCVISNPEISGALNVVAPEVVSQHEFARCLAKALRRPCLLPMPGFLVRLLFSEMGETLLLSGQHVKGLRLPELDFEYKYKRLDALFSNLFN